MPVPSNKISELSVHSQQRVAVSPMSIKNDNSNSGHKAHISHSPRSHVSGIK